MSVDCPEGVVSVQDPVRLQNKPLAGSPSFLEKAFNCHVRSVIYLGGSRAFTKKYIQPVALRMTTRPKFDAFKHLGSLLGVGVTVKDKMLYVFDSSTVAHFARTVHCWKLRLTSYPFQDREAPSSAHQLESPPDWFLSIVQIGFWH